MWLPILDQFEVEVRFLTRAERDAIDRKCRKKKIQSGRIEETLDEAIYAREASRAYIADCRGLTNSVIRQLGVPLEEDVPEDADGTIPYDQDLIEDLFRESYASKFALPVLNFATEMLGLVELDERLKKSDSGS